MFCRQKNGLCQNTFGSFDCSSCLDGYQFNGLTGTCDDVDECSFGVCSGQAFCTNSDGRCGAIEFAL